MASDTQNNIKKIFCNNFDPDNIIFKNMKAPILYPMYKIDDQSYPIIIQSPFVTLEYNPIPTSKFHKTSEGNTIPHFRLYHNTSKPMTEQMQQIFNVFNKIDKYTEEHLDEIVKQEPRIKGQVAYHKCVGNTSLLGKEMNYIQFKINTNIGTVDETETDSKFNVVKVYYKSNLQNTQYKIHKIEELNKILKSGKRVRFIFAIKKFWFNHSIAGYSVKIMQMEIDDCLSDRFRMIKSLDNNETNMFNREKYNEYMERLIKYGPNRSQKLNENKKILKIINETSDKYLFNDKDEDYVSIEPIIII